MKDRYLKNAGRELDNDKLSMYFLGTTIDNLTWKGGRCLQMISICSDSCKCEKKYTRKDHIDLAQGKIDNKMPKWNGVYMRFVGPPSVMNPFGPPSIDLDTTDKFISEIERKWKNSILS